MAGFYFIQKLFESAGTPVDIAFFGCFISFYNFPFQFTHVMNRIMVPAVKFVTRKWISMNAHVNLALHWVKMENHATKV